MDAPEEVLLDLNALGKDHKFVGLGGFVVSDDHNLLAYTIDYTGFRQYAPAGEGSAHAGRRSPTPPAASRPWPGPPTTRRSS